MSAAILASFVLIAATPSAEVKAGAVTDHVIVISIDGLRPDAIDKYQLSTLMRLRAEGAHATEARTIFPSKTLPSHTSMLTGVGPEIHGVTWNSDRTAEFGVVETPTVFAIAKAGGFTTAAFFSKAKFHHLQQPGTLDYTQAPSGLEVFMATRTVPDAINYLRHRRPNLLFVHIGEPDYAGHSIGWMSFAYGWAARRADGAVGTLLEAADRTYGKGNYTVLVTADHGGHSRDHGSDDARDMTIPWIVWGEGVNAHMTVGQVKTMDTAATALWLLGLRAPPQWQGVAVASAFTNAAQLAVTTATAATTTATLH